MKSRQFLSWCKTASIRKITRNLPRKILAGWMMVMLLWPNVMVVLSEPIFAATSPWSQTDWIGGSGQSTWSDVTKFDSSSNVVTSAAGQTTLTNSEKLTNTGIETDLTGWNQSGEGVASNFADATFANSSGAVAAWPLDETTSTQSYSRAVNPAASSGRNIVINGGFDSDTIWTKGTGWTISGGTTHNDGTGSNAALSQPNILVLGKSYQVTFTVSNFVSGNVRAILGSTGTGTGRTANGTYIETIFCTGANSNFQISTNANFVGDIDNVTVTELNIPAYNATPTQLLTDGNMESAGTGSWTAGNSIMSKETGNPHGGSQVLRLTRSASPFRAGQAILTPGTVYRVTGYMRSDGSASPIVDDNTTRLLTGSVATNWQPIDLLFTATSSTLNLGGTGSGSSYVEFDDVVVSVDNGIRQTELLMDGNMEAAVTTSGTATSATSNTLSDTGKSWTTNSYINQILTITGGTGSGQTRIISSNTATAITVSSVWTVTPDSTSQYQVIPFWISVSGAPAISKQSTSPHGGTQVLRMARSGSSTTLINQISTTYIPGKTYRWTGYVRSDGSATPRISNSGGALYFSGTTSTSWQPIDVTFIYPSTGATGLTLVASVDGQYIEWDDLSVTEVNPMSAIPTNAVVIGSTASGHLTNAYTFDGVNDNVNIYSGELNSVFNPDEGTAVVWAKASGSGVWTDATVRYLLSLTGPTGNKINLYRSSTNNTLALDYSANSVQELITSSAIGGGTSWFQVVATWSKASDQVKFYINGTQVGSTATGLGTWSGNIGSTTGAIGALGSGGSNAWSGMINDVRLYNRPLTATEISTMYNGGVATRDTSIFHSGVASMKVVTDSTSNLDVLQSVNVGDTNTYALSAYAYTDGSAVTTADAELFYNGATVSTTYTSVGSGWYKLSGTVTGANAARDYGAQVKANKTVYLDDFSVNSYAASGTLTSSIFDTSQGSNWGVLTYNATTPTGTSVTVKARSSNSSTMVGATAFSSCTGITSGTDMSGNSCMADNNRYIQYQVTLTATDTSVTPTFQDITIPFVISDSSAPGVSLTPLSPDPTRDNTPTLTGTVTEDIGTVSAVQFQVDSTTGTWTDCSASDGSFNAASENFSCTTSALNDGTHTLYIRSTDSNGNTTSSGFASDTFTIDVTPPLALNLISPSNNAYINNERPSFTWKATSDATSGLAKYVLEIDNTSLGTDQPSGDFSVDNIPADRSSDYITAKYTVHYENFNDSDQTNNSISLVTKSSSEWGDTENDGKLREGHASWKLKAIDNAGNEVAASNGLFIDRTSPTVALTQINTIPASSVNFVTTDKTPTFYGKITDPLSGGDSSLSQDENGPKIASGPKEVRITIEKRNGILYEEVTRATIQIEKAWYTCTDQEIADNTKQLCNKYLPFQFTHKENLAAGLYKITLTGKDTADNTTEASFSLDVTSLSEITTPEEAAIIEEEISSLPPAQQEVVKEQLEITKPAEVRGPSITDQLSEGIYNGKKTIAKVVAQFGDVTKFITERLSSSFISLIHSVGEKVAEAFQTTSRALAFAFNSLFDAGERIIAALNQGYNFLASNAPGVTRSLFLAGQNGFSAAIKNADASIKSKRAGVSLYGKLLSQTSYTVGSQLSQTLISLSSSTAANIQTLSDNTGVMIVRFGYLFIKEPTTISNVTVEIISPTSAKISWKTNTPTNGKVNYGLSETYSLDVQSEELTTTHEFVLTNLQPDTEYYFEVMSHGKMYVYDANRKFKTPAKANYN